MSPVVGNIGRAPSCSGFLKSLSAEQMQKSPLCWFSETRLRALDAPILVMLQRKNYTELTDKELSTLKVDLHAEMRDKKEILYREVVLSHPDMCWLAICPIRSSGEIWQAALDALIADYLAIRKSSSNDMENLGTKDDSGAGIDADPITVTPAKHEPPTDTANMIETSETTGEAAEPTTKKLTRKIKKDTPDALKTAKTTENAVDAAAEEKPKATRKSPHKVPASSVKTEQKTTKATKPKSSTTKPKTPVTKPKTPVIKPKTPVTKPKTPVTKPKTPVTKPKAPSTKPRAPPARKRASAVKPESIAKSSPDDKGRVASQISESTPTHEDVSSEDEDITDLKAQLTNAEEKLKKAKSLKRKAIDGLKGRIAKTNARAEKAEADIQALAM